MPAERDPRRTRLPEKPASASKACPKVWPRLRSASRRSRARRAPRSRPWRGSWWRSPARARDRPRTLPASRSPARRRRRHRRGPAVGDLGIAGGELTARQRIEQGGVGHHQDRLVEGSDQVLAMLGDRSRSCRRPRIDCASSVVPAPVRSRGRGARRASIDPRPRRPRARPRRSPRSVRAAIKGLTGPCSSIAKLLELSPAGTVTTVAAMPACASTASAAAR